MKPETWILLYLQIENNVENLLLKENQCLKKKCFSICFIPMIYRGTTVQ